MTSAMALHKSVELLPNCFVIKFLLHLSASSPGSAPPLVLTAALFTKSASIASNLLDVLVRLYLSVKHPTLPIYPLDGFALTGSRFSDLMEGSLSACYQSIV